MKNSLLGVIEELRDVLQVFGRALKENKSPILNQETLKLVNQSARVNFGQELDCSP